MTNHDLVTGGFANIDIFLIITVMIKTCDDLYLILAI